MKIDPRAAASLRALLRHNHAAIRQLETWLPANSGPWDFNRKAAVGYVLHNIYNALENCFEQISRSFENHVVDDGKWHAELLAKMFLDLEGLRPPLFSAGIRPLLNDLRGFRHVFRHGYGVELDEAKLEKLMADWSAGRANVLGEIESFAARLPETGG